MNDVQLTDLSSYPPSGSPSLCRAGSFRRSWNGPSSLQNELLLMGGQQDYRRLPRFEPVDGPADRTFKVVFAGDAAVGKSSFITRLHSDVFVAHTQTTLGVDFKVKTFRLDERNIVVQLWDTAGKKKTGRP